VSEPRAPSSALISGLVTLASRTTGVAESAIHGDSLIRFARTATSRFGSEAEVLARASRDDPTLRDALAQAIAVGETFFFRHPEHFTFVVDRLRARKFDRPIRVWSAACATGEEAYSLAAWFSNELTSPIEVLGTDLLESQLRIAETGTYRRWSIRESAPFPYRVLEPASPDTFTVRDDIRKLVRFETHNLLDPTVRGPFDVIFCRNVLIYFTPGSAAAACEHLFGALADGGVLVFGTMDLVSLPSSARRIGPATIQAFTRGGARSVSAPRPAARATRDASAKAAASRPLSSLPPRQTTPLVAEAAPHARTKSSLASDVAMHVDALARLEHGDSRSAHSVLLALVDAHPRYVPGALELAMLESRLGHPRKSTALMRRVLESLAGTDDDAVVDAPEPLRARFYRETADAWLRTKGASGEGGRR